LLTISVEDVATRLRADNPWWERPLDLSVPPFSLPQRAYYAQLAKLVAAPVRRAIVLLGSRRVGKTTQPGDSC
jgi:uncharacterized protein